MKRKKDLNIPMLIKEFQAGTAICVMAVMQETSKERIKHTLVEAGMDLKNRTRPKPWRTGRGYKDVVEYGVWDGQ